ncbi:hypothetical protein HELRODRAFT_165974 [Helobdella robusta]|uniref:Uncharacterized protein n=1 Tax=Helobdella robusta TaxID=6412 RepID=T1EXI9_HELRO|nr:hypothetical protein HELRODRAFT_165974 [Helobdella robusta]ESN90319.1 hypothetical protein HELRODRAFT_165974 [Helobdella robusta]
MDVEEDLLIVDEVGVSSQQAGREQTSARPVFSDPERVYCRVADPGQERLRRSEGSGGYSYADAVRDRVQKESEKVTTTKPSTFTDGQTQLRQEGIVAGFQRSDKWSADNPQSKAITTALIRMIAIDMQPLSIV